MKIIIKGWFNKKKNKNKGKKWDHQKIYNIKEFSYNVFNQEKVIHKKMNKVKEINNNLNQGDTLKI